MPLLFDSTGLEHPDLSTWVQPVTGDRVALDYFTVVPDLPTTLDNMPKLRHDLAVFTAEDGGCLIEAALVKFAGVPALVRVIKLPLPGQPTGQVFVGSITVPKAAASAVLQIVCPEHGVTGVREATLMAQLGPTNWTRPHPYAPELTDTPLPYHAGDDPRWDSQFPDHPLTRARAWLHRALRTAIIDPGFASLPPFRTGAPSLNGPQSGAPASGAPSQPGTAAPGAPDAGNPEHGGPASDAPGGPQSGTADPGTAGSGTPQPDAPSPAQQSAPVSVSPAPGAPSPAQPDVPVSGSAQSGVPAPGQQPPAESPEASASPIAGQVQPSGAPAGQPAAQPPAGPPPAQPAEAPADSAAAAPAQPADPGAAPQAAAPAESATELPAAAEPQPTPVSARNGPAHAAPDPAADAAQEAPAAPQGPPAGARLTITAAGIPIGGYLPLWLDNKSVVYWKLEDPNRVLERLGSGSTGRMALAEEWRRDALMLDLDGSGLYFTDRYQSEDGGLGMELVPGRLAEFSEAEAAANSETMTDAFRWVGNVFLQTASRSELMAIGPGGTTMYGRPRVLMWVNPGDGNPFTSLSASPVPIEAQIWKDRLPADAEITPEAAQTVLGNDASPEAFRAGGLMAGMAAETWSIPITQLSISFRQLT